jgi:hypothetical protein
LTVGGPCTPPCFQVLSLSQGTWSLHIRISSFSHQFIATLLVLETWKYLSIYYIIKTQDNEGPRFNNLAQQHINDGDLSAWNLMQQKVPAIYRFVLAMDSFNRSIPTLSCNIRRSWSPLAKWDLQRVRYFRVIRRHPNFLASYSCLQS